MASHLSSLFFLFTSDNNAENATKMYFIAIKAKTIKTLKWNVLFVACFFLQWRRSNSRCSERPIENIYLLRVHNASIEITMQNSENRVMCRPNINYMGTRDYALFE